MNADVSNEQQGKSHLLEMGPCAHVLLAAILPNRSPNQEDQKMLPIAPGDGNPNINLPVMHGEGSLFKP